MDIELKNAIANATRANKISAAVVIHESPRAPPDFVQALPDRPTIDTLVSMFESSSAAQGAVLVSVGATTRVASVASLGRVEVSVALRGSYPQVKAIITTAIQSTPALVIHRLSMRRLASPAEVDAQLELWLLARPLASPASGRRP